MTFVFGWWLYSFISLVRSEYNLEKENLNLNALLIRKRLSLDLESMNNDSKLSPYQFYLKNKSYVDSNLLKLNEELSTETYLIIKDTNASFSGLYDVVVHPREFKQKEKRYNSKKRAYYSEVLFFGLLVIAGSVWIFTKLESLLKLNKLQNNFLLSITHELKTPLAAIKLSSETLLKRNLDAEMSRQIVSQTLSNAERLNDLIDNVLLATNIDSQTYQFKMQDLNLSDLIHETADVVFVEPHFKGQLNIKTNSQRIYGDELAIKLVLSNIFNNAIKYGGEYVEVDIKTETERRYEKLIISDNGIGIDVKESKQIFKKFYRIGDEETRETKGTGLGLYIVKEILKYHKAKIEIKPNEPKGTQFILTFKKLKV
jgi:signal transduction histidine kinase